MSAPYSRIVTAPVPADTGSTLVVAAGDGPKFPEPPFVFLAWPVETLPTALNSVEAEVSRVVGDTFTFDRGTESPVVDLEAGMMISVVERVPEINLGELIRLEISYVTADTPYTLRLTNPQGEVSTVLGAAGVDEDGDTVYYVEQVGDVSGRWCYRWEVGPDDRATADAFFFVRHTGSQ